MGDKKEYIERGALIEFVKQNTPHIDGDTTMQCVERAMKAAPAADVVEVVHGEWIDKPTGAYGRMQSWCSACGKHSGIGGIESNRHKPYCPNCGARMDGERKENP